MLAIRMQRTGRKGHAQFRLIVQEARLTPTSGKLVAHLGSYNPHTKAVIVDKEKASFFLEHGAQPSDRVALLLKQEGVKLPKWVKLADTKKKSAVRNPEKLRRNRPAGEPAPEPKAAEEAPAEAVAEAPAETVEAAEEAPVEVAEATEAEAEPAAEPEADEATKA